MREILFRGKRTDKDKWIYGVPVKGTSADESEILIIESVFECDEYVCRGCEFTPVIPSTVGQYTGLKDKNGKRIFEGDICKHRSNFSGNTVISVVTYTDGHFLALVCKNSGFELSEKLEVIGNIHDNPELLKGGEG